MTNSLHRSANRLAHVLTLSAAIVVAAASTLVAQNVQGNQPVQYRTLSADELDSIVAPVALYADPREHVQQHRASNQDRLLLQPPRTTNLGGLTKS